MVVLKMIDWARLSFKKETLFITVDIHKDKPVKCRQLVLDSSTGKLKYQTKQFDVLPSELQQSRKYISCDSFNETICIQASSDCSPFRKRQKNDRTTRIRQNLFGSTLENTCAGLNLHNQSAETLGEDKINKSIFKTAPRLLFLDCIRPILFQIMLRSMFGNTSAFRI